MSIGGDSFCRGNRRIHAPKCRENCRSGDLRQACRGNTTCPERARYRGHFEDATTGKSNRNSWILTFLYCLEDFSEDALVGKGMMQPIRCGGSMATTYLSTFGAVASALPVTLVSLMARGLNSGPQFFANGQSPIMVDRPLQSKLDTRHSRSCTAGKRPPGFSRPNDSGGRGLTHGPTAQRQHILRPSQPACRRTFGAGGQQALRLFRWTDDASK